MTITMLIPDWGADPELANFAAKRKGVKGLNDRIRGYKVRYNHLQSCDMIQLNGRAETMPEELRSLPMQAIIILKHNSPVTAAVDGPYEDGDISARVETYIRDGVTQQSIRVTGANGTMIEELNKWFDDLVAGVKASKNRIPAQYPVPARIDQATTQ